MKKTFFTHLFLWCLVLGFAFTSVAQNQSVVGKVPTTTEKPVVNYTYGEAPTGGSTAYAHSSINAQFVSMPIPAGTPFTTLFAWSAGNGGFASSATFGPNGTSGPLYVTEFSGSAPALWNVDVGTGTVTLVGNTGVDINGITYDASTGTYYACSSTDLYTIDVTTGATTLVGAFGIGGELMVDLAVDCDGNMFAYDLVTDAFYSIDKSTGAATFMFALGYDANFGQGMSYDHSTGTLYLSAFNNGTFTGQLREVDFGGSTTVLVFDWGFDQLAPFAIDQLCGPPCPVGQATNPNPADGATDVSVNVGSLSWTNDPAATSIEVYFGEVGNMSLIYSGAPVTSVSIGTLNYATDYSWRVDGSDGTCTTMGQTWFFTTEQDPNLVCAFMDDFESGTGNWDIVNDGGDCVWDVFDIVSRGYTMPPEAQGNAFAADADACGSGTTTLTTATMVSPVDASIYQQVWIEFDNDFRTISASDEAYVEVSTDGTNWTTVASWIGVDNRDTHEIIDISTEAALQPTVWVRLRSIQPGWDWWWAVDNFSIYMSDPVPVELSSFAASVNDNEVTLNWSTATETNNQGFEVQRSTNGSEFVAVGFVDGNGTTTEVHNYSFTDKNLEVGTYTYRLKQIDFDGTFAYSNTIEVDVVAPDQYALEQNYPNPFNPSTVIKFSLAADSKVSLKVFDVLGQEVATLINGQLTAGSHQINFNAANLNSGVYFYRIEATGVDGTNFTSVKKMILTK